MTRTMSDRPSAFAGLSGVFAEDGEVAELAPERVDRTAEEGIV
jgi:hypothetical protein